MADFALKGLTDIQVAEYFTTALRNSAQSLVEAQHRDTQFSATYEAIAAQTASPAPEGLPPQQFADIQKNALAQAALQRLNAHLDLLRVTAGHDALLAEKARLTATSAGA